MAEESLNHRRAQNSVEIDSSALDALVLLPSLYSKAIAHAMPHQFVIGAIGFASLIFSCQLPCASRQCRPDESARPRNLVLGIQNFDRELPRPGVSRMVGNA